MTLASTPPRAAALTWLSGAWAGVSSSPILRIIIKRLLMAIPIMLGVSILTFWVLASIPGNAAQLQLGINATPEQIATLEKQLGLDQPAIQRYLDWLGGLLTGDLGRSSVSSQPVTSLIADRLPVSAELVGLAFVLSLAVSIPVALVSARRPGGIIDRIAMVIAATGQSIANYVLALLLVLIFAVKAGVLPAIGFTPISEDLGENLKGMVLPTLALAFPLMCFYTRFLRSDLVDQLQREDYVDTARAKGAGPWRVLLRHAFRNSSFGLITLVGLNVSVLIGVTVITEQIFAMPGLGQLLLQGINTRDFVVVQDLVILFAAITVVVNLIVDLLYVILDPRIRYGSR